MKIIPAIDLLDGEVVRLHKGDYDSKTVYGNDPFEQAALFSEAGFDRIHIVDLNGARDGEFRNLSHTVRIVTELDLTVQTGGGVRSLDDITKLLDSGISRVICSSMAVRKPDQWIEALRRYPDRCILGLDLKEGKLSYGGWTRTDERSLETVLAPMLEAGLREVLSTDISRDGTLGGPNIELYGELLAKYPELSWIASGGVSSIEDLHRLQSAGVTGVVVGKAYYEGRVTLKELAEFANRSSSAEC